MNSVTFIPWLAMATMFATIFMLPLMSDGPPSRPSHEGNKDRSARSSAGFPTKKNQNS